MKMQSINPYTEELMEEFRTPDESGAGPGGREHPARPSGPGGTCPWKSGRAYVKRLGDHLREEKRKYGELITREMGKPIREALAEIEKCAWLCDYYGENAALFLAPEEVETEAKRSYVAFEPLGVVLAIMPWNFPFWQVFRFGIPAISAGNCVLLKHAPSVPATALAIEAAFTAAGFPQGCLPDGARRSSRRPRAP